MKNLFAVVALISSFATAAVLGNVADEIKCHLKIWGDMPDNPDSGTPFPFPPAPGPYGLISPSPWLQLRPMDSLSEDEIVSRFTKTNAQPKFMRLSAAAIRKPSAVPQSKYNWTIAYTNMAGTVSDAKGANSWVVYLWFGYRHAIMDDSATGKPTKAAVKPYLHTGLIPAGIPGPVIQGIVIENPDPFDPKSGFKEVKLINGVPDATFVQSGFFEGPGGTAVIKATCTVGVGLTPIPADDGTPFPIAEGTPFPGSDGKR